MSDRFQEALTKYREEIRNGGLQSLKERLASGAIAYDHKVRAANFAIREHEDRESNTHVFDPLPLTNMQKLSNLLPGWFMVMWKDPVWSKVISHGIIVLLSAALLYFFAVGQGWLR